jgi:hypothetical protein
LFLTKQMADTERKYPDVLPPPISLSRNSNILCEHARASTKKHSGSKRREGEREKKHIDNTRGAILTCKFPLSIN